LLGEDLRAATRRRSRLWRASARIGLETPVLELSYAEA
jgi:hypothetical protein